MIGAVTGDMSGREAMNSPEDDPATTDWCAGGCSHHSETEDGRKRYEELQIRYEEYQKGKKV